MPGEISNLTFPAGALLPELFYYSYERNIHDLWYNISMKYFNLIIAFISFFITCALVGGAFISFDIDLAVPALIFAIVFFTIFYKAAKAYKDAIKSESESHNSLIY